MTVATTERKRIEIVKKLYFTNTLDMYIYERVGVKPSSLTVL